MCKEKQHSGSEKCADVMESNILFTLIVDILNEVCLIWHEKVSS